MPQVSCDWCGQKCYKRPSALKQRAHAFCSKKCWHEWQNRNHKPNTVCDNCSKEFFRSPSNKSRRPEQKSFCSWECKVEFSRRDQVEFICETCGQPFQVSPSTAEYNACRFCSPECAGTKAQWVPIVCDQCAAVFMVPPSRQGTARYCSAECKQLHEQDQIELKCQQCGQAYRVRSGRAGVSRFCSLDCRVTYYREHPSPLYNQVSVTCEWCGKSYDVKPSKLESTRFCSLACSGAWHSATICGESHPGWKGGPIDEYGSNWQHQRHLVLQRDGYCQICGADKSANGQELDVHHVVPIREFDGDWKGANKLDNLVALCRSCHAAVECGQIDYSTS